MDKFINIKKRTFVVWSFLLIMVGLTTACQAKSDNDPVEAIYVTGKAAVSVVPDKLSVHLYIEEQNLSVSAAKNIVDAKSKKLLSSLNAQGIDDSHIQSYQLNIHPYYENTPNNRNKQNGFMVSRTFEIDLDNWDKFDSIIDKALGLGVTRVGQIETHISDSYAVYLSALDQAVEQARSKAKILAKQADRSLGKIIEIREQGGHQYYAAEAMSLRKSVSQPGTNQVEASVSVTFGLK